MNAFSQINPLGKRAEPVDFAELEYLAALGDLVDAVRLEWALNAMRTDGGENMNDHTHHSGTDLGTDRPTHDARNLTQGGKQAHIRLDDKIYTLMITRAGKLILTK